MLFYEFFYFFIIIIKNFNKIFVIFYIFFLFKQRGTPILITKKKKKNQGKIYLNKKIYIFLHTLDKKDRIKLGRRPSSCPIRTQNST